MRYWVYSQGQIQGPIHAQGLLGLAGFGAESLVCPEGVEGNQPADWRRASTVPALAGFFSGPGVAAEPVPAPAREGAIPVAALSPVLPGEGSGPGPLEPWFPASPEEGDILSHLDDFWKQVKTSSSGSEGGPEAEARIGEMESRVFELEQRLQTYDLDQKALLRKIEDKDALLSELMSKIEPLESRLREAEADKQKALSEMRSEIARLKEELRRKDREVEALRGQGPSAGEAPSAPRLDTAGIELEKYLAELEASLGTGVLPPPPKFPEMGPVPRFGPEVTEEEAASGLPTSTPAPSVGEAEVAEGTLAVPETLPGAAVPPAGSAALVPSEEDGPFTEKTLPRARKLLVRDTLDPAEVPSPIFMGEPSPPRVEVPAAPTPEPMEAFHIPEPTPMAPPPLPAPQAPPAPGLPPFEIEPPGLPPAPEPTLSPLAGLFGPGQAQPPGPVIPPVPPVPPVGAPGPRTAGPGGVRPPAQPTLPGGAKLSMPSGPGQTQAPGAVPAGPIGLRPPPKADPAAAQVNELMARLKPKPEDQAGAQAATEPPGSPVLENLARLPGLGALLVKFGVVPPPPATSTVPPAAAPTGTPPGGAPARPSGTKGQKVKKLAGLVAALAVTGLGMLGGIIVLQPPKKASGPPGPVAEEVPGAGTPGEAGQPQQAAAGPAAAPGIPPGGLPDETGGFPASPPAGGAQGFAPEAVSAPPPSPAPARPAPVELPPTVQAIQFAKSYPLPGGRGTLGRKFREAFAAEKEEDLSEDWSATEISENVFIVEYKVLRILEDGTADKVRNYLFEANLGSREFKGFNKAAERLLAGEAEPSPAGRGSKGRSARGKASQSDLPPPEDEAPEEGDLAPPDEG